MPRVALVLSVLVLCSACSNSGNSNHVKRPTENMEHLTTERLAAENAKTRKSRSRVIIDKEMDDYFKQQTKNISDLTIKSIFGQ